MDSLLISCRNSGVPGAEFRGQLAYPLDDYKIELNRVQNGTRVFPGTDACRNCASGRRVQISHSRVLLTFADGSDVARSGSTFVAALTVALAMIFLDEIRVKTLRREYELSKHAVDQSIVRAITIAELEEAIANRAEVIEDYPDDKYGPSCLILGFTKAGRPLHVLCSYPSRPILKIVTIYEPDPTLWLDFRTRQPV